MASKVFAWECECGNIEYGPYPPEECSECAALDSFVKIPEDEVVEREEENVLANKRKEEDYD